MREKLEAMKADMVRMGNSGNSQLHDLLAEMIEAIEELQATITDHVLNTK